MGVEVEHTIRVIPIDSDFQNALKKLEAEGYDMIPGVTPVAVYHLVRSKEVPAPAEGAQGIIKIDDAQVHILRDGKLVPL